MEQILVEKMDKVDGKMDRKMDGEAGLVEV